MSALSLDVGRQIDPAGSNPDIHGTHNLKKVNTIHYCVFNT
jgi:hypothetical protein